MSTMDEIQPVVDELRRRMADGHGVERAIATDSSHVAAVIVRLMQFVQHTSACLGARSRHSCECGAARAMEDAKDVAVALSVPSPAAKVKT